MKEKPPVRAFPNKADKIVHISNKLHKKLKMFCAEFELEIGKTAEKAISDYLRRAG